MSEKVKNIVIAISVLIAATGYAYSTVSTTNRTNNYFNKLDNDRTECLIEGDNAGNFTSAGYDICMRYKGYDSSFYK